MKPRRSFDIHDIDNRDSAETVSGLEARVEAMARRIKELEAEVERLRKGVSIAAGLDQIFKD